MDNEFNIPADLPADVRAALLAQMGRERRKCLRDTRNVIYTATHVIGDGYTGRARERARRLRQRQRNWGRLS